MWSRRICSSSSGSAIWQTFASPPKRARLDLAVLLFPDPLTPYTLTNDLDQPSVLPTKAEVQADGAKNNPDLRAALQSARAAKFQLNAAKAAYLPDLSLHTSMESTRRSSR